MALVMTLAWAPQTPRFANIETREVRDVAGWVAKVDADAREWGVCLLMTDVTSKPARLLAYIKDGEAGTACVTARLLRG